MPAPGKENWTEMLVMREGEGDRERERGRGGETFLSEIGRKFIPLFTAVNRRKLCVVCSWVEVLLYYKVGKANVTV